MDISFWGSRSPRPRVTHRWMLTDVTRTTRPHSPNPVWPSSWCQASRAGQWPWPLREASGRRPKQPCRVSPPLLLPALPGSASFDRPLLPFPFKAAPRPSGPRAHCQAQEQPHATGSGVVLGGGDVPCTEGAQQHPRPRPAGRQEHPLTVTLKNVPRGCQMSPGDRVTPGREHGHTKWWKQADIPESEGGSCTDHRGACSHSRTF